MNDIKKGSAANDRQPSRIHLQFTKNVSAADLKMAAKGRWLEILSAAGMPAECLNKRNQPCPKCGGEDRFNAGNDVEQSGAVFCRHCFSKDSAIRPGDGIATVAWLLNLTNGEAIKWLADYLGLTNDPAAPKPDLIEQVCRDKRMPREAFEKYGVRVAKRGREKRLVVRVDCYNASGHVHSHFDMWPGDKGRFKPGKGSAGLFLPGRPPAAGELWLLVEGCKDSAALTGLGFNACGLPGASLPASFAKLFRGVDVLLVPDLDEAGQNGAHKTAANLFGVAASVRVARLPGEMQKNRGDDVRDVLRKPDGKQLVHAAIDAAQTWKPSKIQTGTKPELHISLNESEVTQEAIKHLGQLGVSSPWINAELQDSVCVYTRGGVLVRPVKSDDIETLGRTTIQTLPTCLVRERLTDACKFLGYRQAKFGDWEYKPIRPPSWLVESIHRRGGYDGNVRPLTGIVQAPTIRSDGSILQTRGYDAPTGLLYEPSVDFPTVPNTPTKENANAALDVLADTLCDFPMLSHADRSAWLTMVLSMIGRPSFTGGCPLFAITANVRGAGKSLLADAASLIAFGHSAGRKAFTRDGDELRKVITAVALEATPAVLFDNLDTQLGGAALDAVLTGSTWSDRVLGQSRMTGDLPMRTVWSATGNNLSFGSDVARRVLPIRLHSELETPEDRTGFKHPNLLAWVERERPRLAVAALTALRAYFVAGCPLQAGGDWGSFEAWSSVIRGCIVWSGFADPLPTRQTATAQDETASLLGRLILGIEKADASGIGLTCKEIERCVYGDGRDDPDNDVLAEAVTEICGSRYNGKTLAGRISQLRGRVWEGRSIDNASAHGGVKRWHVKKADGCFGGFGGMQTASAGNDVVCVTPKSSNTKEFSKAEGVGIPPIPPVEEHTHVVESVSGETNPPNPPIPPCDQCGGVLIPSFIEVNGWRNHDCDSCGKVIATPPVSVGTIKNLKKK